MKTAKGIKAKEKTWYRSREHYKDQCKTQTEKAPEKQQIEPTFRNNL
jgi:hypothetical protein